MEPRSLGIRAAGVGTVHFFYGYNTKRKGHGVGCVGYFYMILVAQSYGILKLCFNTDFIRIYRLH